MSKLYKCEKCLREFSRKQHLIQHYNRKIPCINPPNQILYYKDITNILPHGITSGNIIVNNILPTEQMQDDNLSKLWSEDKPEPKTELLPENTAECKAENEIEPISQSSTKALEPEVKSTQPNSTQLNPNAKMKHNKTIKIRPICRQEVAMNVFNKVSVYDELFKRVKKYLESEQVITWYQEEGILDPSINPNISFSELRRFYKKFRTQIEVEYQKIKVLD